MGAMIKTRSVYGPACADDGARVLVSRYWPRGVKKEAVDLWIKDLGPSVELIKKWKGGQISWDLFKKSYGAEHRSEEKKVAFDELNSFLSRLKGGTATLLCTCRDGEPCHRDILKDMLKRQKRR